MVGHSGMTTGMSGQVAIGEAPDIEAIERIARAAMARLPAAFAAHLGDVVMIVEDYADDETLAALGIEHPLDLTGLYHGRPVGEKSSMDSGALPDRIHLYRRAILDEWRSKARWTARRRDPVPDPGRLRAGRPAVVREAFAGSRARWCGDRHRA